MDETTRERIAAFEQLLSLPDATDAARAHRRTEDGYPLRQYGWKRWLPVAYHQHVMLTREARAGWGE